MSGSRHNERSRRCFSWKVTRRLLLVLIVLALITGFVLEFKYYILPWGEAQVKNLLGLPPSADLSDLNSSFVLEHSCSGCVLGSNTDWPTNTTGFSHFLDSQAGTMTSTITAISLGATGAVALVGAVFTDSASSLSSGFYEMQTIIEHGQFLTMMSQLRIEGAPEFLYQFSKEFSWTNFNVESSISDTFASIKAKLGPDSSETSSPSSSASTAGSSAGSSSGSLDGSVSVGSISNDSSASGGSTSNVTSSDDSASSDSGSNGSIVSGSTSGDAAPSGSSLGGSSSSGSSSSGTSGTAGPARYAEMLGVSTEELFFYTLSIFAMVVAAIHAVFLVILLAVGITCRRGSVKQTAEQWYQKVVGLCVLTLLMAQYIFAMAGSYFIFSGDEGSGRFSLGLLLLVCVVGIALLLGIVVVMRNRDEMDDLGTYEHSQRAFSNKYGAYYKEYNFENRYFFIPRILLAVTTGAVVGGVDDPTAQLTCILVLTVIYLGLLMVREPQLLRVMYYVSLAAIVMKVVLLCMMLLLIHDNYLPQYVRDNAAYAIIGINIVIYLLLFVRQLFTMLHKVVLKCKRNRELDGELELGSRAGYSRMADNPRSSRRR